MYIFKIYVDNFKKIYLLSINKNKENVDIGGGDFILIFFVARFK